MGACRRTFVVIGLASLATLPLTAQTTPAKPAGQNGKSAGPAGPGRLSGADTKFVLEAANGGMAEVSLGKLAAEKATSPDVKQFGQRMADDHSKANEELKALASQEGRYASDGRGSRRESCRSASRETLGRGLR